MHSSPARCCGPMRGSVHDEVKAARVAEVVSHMRHDLSSHFRALVEIYAAPQWLWPALVQAMLGAPETETAKEIKPWTVRELPDVEVLAGVGWL